jgi:hypothetical protein
MLRTILLCLPSAILLSACSGVTDPRSPLDVRVAVSARTTSAAAPATITVTIRNTGSSRIEIPYSCGEPLVRVERADGTRLQNEEIVCTTLLSILPLDAGATHSIRTTWPELVQSLMAGRPIAPGVYRIRASAAAEEGASVVTDMTEIELLP